MSGPDVMSGSSLPRLPVVVLGGNGTVGLGVLEALVGAGDFAVHAICRRGGPPSGFLGGSQPGWLQQVRWHACDVQDGPALAACLAHIEPRAGVIAMGRLQPINQLRPGRRAGVERDARDPPLRGVAALAAAGAASLVYVSGLFPSPVHGSPGTARQLLDRWLEPQRLAKAAVEDRVQALFGAESSLIIRAGLVCGWNEVGGLRIWTPPGTRAPSHVRALRRVVPDAVSAVEIGAAVTDFLRGDRPGGVLSGAEVVANVSDHGQR